MASSTYTVSGEGVESVTRSSKASAIKLADELRAEHKVTVSVSTGAGTEVYVAKARKAGAQTERFTRVDSREVAKHLGEGVKLPKGFEVAYLRPRAGLALLRKRTADGTTSYLVFNLANGESEGVESTREGGAKMTSLRKAALELVA